ncbi:MAG: ABC transporter substrate-binding protein [Methanobacteriota archaeon]|nr:MAG: ABC transporter substrate-binding protein [Euryarchaeota archaeon]
MARLRTNVAFAAVALSAILVSIAILAAYLSVQSDSVVRLGYFPNVTHAQSLYGISTGAYQAALGSALTLEPRAFNAGPTGIAALLANRVDLLFVGPSPTLTGLAAVGPDVLRVIAGGASGGALFVIQPTLNLTTSANYTGRKFASPQLGNTQDIALKHFLLSEGHKTVDQGGDVEVINAANPNILSLFQLRQIDGAWVPEPWASRLVLEAGGKVFLDERSLWPNGRFVTTQLVTTKRYLDTHRDIVKRFLDDAITKVTLNRLANATIAAAFGNLNLTYDPIKSSLVTYLAWAQELGLLPAGVDTSGLYDLSLLNEILASRGLSPVN